MKLKKMFEPTTIILIGGFVTLLCTYIAQKQQDFENKKDQENLLLQNTQMRQDLDIANKSQIVRDNEIRQLQEQLIHNARIQINEQKELRLKSEEIAGLYKEIASSQYRISAKNEEINNNIIGGDSNPFLTIEIPFRQKFGDIFLHNDGKYPLYDIKISMINISAIKENKNGNWVVGRYTLPLLMSENYIFEENIPTLSPNGKVLIGKIDANFDNEDIRVYNVHLSARNNEWFQDLVITQFGSGRMIMKEASSRLYKLDNSILPGKKFFLKDYGVKENYSGMPQRLIDEIQTKVGKVNWDDIDTYWDGETLYIEKSYIKIK